MVLDAAGATERHALSLLHEAGSVHLDLGEVEPEDLADGGGDPAAALLVLEHRTVPPVLPEQVSRRTSRSVPTAQTLPGRPPSNHGRLRAARQSACVRYIVRLCSEVASVPIGGEAKMRSPLPLSMQGSMVTSLTAKPERRLPWLGIAERARGFGGP